MRNLSTSGINFRAESEILEKNSPWLCVRYTRTYNHALLAPSQLVQIINFEVITIFKEFF